MFQPGEEEKNDRDNIKEDLDQMKLEMIRELRDMKNNIKQSTESNHELLKEIKLLNKSLIT